MAEKIVCVAIDEDFLNALKARTGLREDDAVIREAMTVFNWAAEERAQRRLVLSTDEKGRDVHKLTTQALESAAAKGGPRHIR